MALSEELKTLQGALSKQLADFAATNKLQEEYYEGSRKNDQIDPSIPPQLQSMDISCGWPGIVVDSINDRMNWRGWYSPNDDVNAFLEGLFFSNSLGVESGQSVLDALIFGVGFFSVGAGDVSLGEPEVLIKAESPNRVTGLWDPRQRRLANGYVELFDNEGKKTGSQIYLPSSTIIVEGEGDKAIASEVPHNFGRVPLCQITNRPRASRPGGRSEITKDVRNITNSAVRTLIGMETSRMFYGAPQRYAMGATLEQFQDQNGNQVSPWTAVMSQIMALPRDEDGNIPTVGSFDAASPLPFTEVLKSFAQVISGATGLPASHFGFGSDNPSSADAIRETNARLDARAMQRQSQFNLGFVELARIALAVAGVAVDPQVRIECRWADPSTATPAAAADRTQKLVAAEVLPARCDVTWEGLGFGPVDIDRIQDAWAEQEAAGLRVAAQTARTLSDPFAAGLVDANLS